MGKSLKSLAPVIGTAAGAFFGGPAGAAIGGTLGGLLGGAPKGPKLTTGNRSLYDVSQEAGLASSEYGKLLNRSRATSESGGAAPEVIKQMGEAALGRGPSLAEAQLKSAQDRNLAQQLGAIQGSRAGSSALGQRALLQSMGASGQDLAQQAAIARLGERANFLQASGAADAGLRSDIQGKLGVDVMPKQSMQAYDAATTAAANQQAQAKAAAKSNMFGSLVGGAASALGSYLGKPATPVPPVPVAKGGHITKKKFAEHLAKMNGYSKGGTVKRYGDTSDIKTDAEKTEALRQRDESAPRDTQEQEQERARKSAEITAYYQHKALEREAVSQRDPAAADLSYKKRPTRFQNKAKGGEIDGPGTETSDSIPAMLSDGEFVIKAKEVKKPGILAHLEAINSGKVTKKHLKALSEAIKEKQKGKSHGR